MNRADPPTQASDQSLLNPRVAIPFLVVSLIWGSTWLVIRDQLGTVPASWSVCYRFAVAAVGMFLLSAITRQSLRIDANGLKWTVLLGLMQFTLNFNFVYAAEHHITSGLVAVIFALLIVPNALLGKWWLGRDFSRNFIIGSLIASAGVALLMVQEYKAAPVGGQEVIVGTALTLIAVLCASVSNVMQVAPSVGRFPTTAILAWSMLWGALFNAAWSFINHGPPIIEMRAGYLGGVLYLGIIGSVVTFPLYFDLIRKIGPGKAAYTSVLIPVVAMLLSTLFEGYAWTALAAGGAILASVGLVVAMRTR
ncbi:DMT family transporter [Sphingorhabdus buctiana]|uniref:DMT family transporter n=1 Tax=Sphingorhabdus buctiana TaxID=1508805 RepID=UPI0036D3A455